ncbi:kinetochore protein Ndc80 [Artemisia annua]|uniref:Kinetochore protein Ndc80 n=1 Tax=Artemisia annua TaxID=35608 RepID=A0A2U1QJG7_ARTAN|nr:kinetochore protein Ndc80 [Artemisia annua]
MEDVASLEAKLGPSLSKQERNSNEVSRDSIHIVHLIRNVSRQKIGDEPHFLLRHQSPPSSFAIITGLIDYTRCISAIGSALGSNDRAFRYADYTRHICDYDDDGCTMPDLTPIMKDVGIEKKKCQDVKFVNVSDLVTKKRQQEVNGSGHGSNTSSISNYLIDTLPGWQVEDFLDPIPNFSKCIIEYIRASVSMVRASMIMISALLFILMHQYVCLVYQFICYCLYCFVEAFVVPKCRLVLRSAVIVVGRLSNVADWGLEMLRWKVIRKKHMEEKEKASGVKVEERNMIYVENEDLKKKVEEQGFNMRDDERMKRELQAVERDIGEAEIERNKWEEKCWDLNTVIGTKWKELEALQIECNQAIRSLNTESWNSKKGIQSFEQDQIVAVNDFIVERVAAKAAWVKSNKHGQKDFGAVYKTLPQLSYHLHEAKLTASEFCSFVVHSFGICILLIQMGFEFAGKAVTYAFQMAMFMFSSNLNQFLLNAYGQSLNGTTRKVVFSCNRIDWCLNAKRKRICRFPQPHQVWALHEPGFCKIFKNELKICGHYLNIPFDRRLKAFTVIQASLIVYGHGLYEHRCNCSKRSMYN